MALREINLIPDETLHKRLLIRHVALWTGCLFVSLALIFGIYHYQLDMVRKHYRPRTTLQDMHTQLGATLTEIKITQQELEQLSHQDAFLKTLNTSQPFSEVLLKVSSIINPRTWLIRLVVNSRPDNEQVAAGIQLQGYSLSNEDVGNFLTRLAEEPLFKNVVLRYAREARINPSPGGSKELVKVIQFQIDCETPRYKGI